jgi:hypothetical protein
MLSIEASACQSYATGKKQDLHEEAVQIKHTKSTGAAETD